MQYDFVTTPAELFSELRELCNVLVPGIEPQYVPTLLEPEYEPLQCFINVATHMERHGGELVVGWALWHWPGVLVEAEYHGVWRNKSQEMYDVTPHDPPNKKILFLPDSNLSYDGSSKNNRRVALHTDPIIKKWFDLMNREYAILNNGVRVDNGGVALTGVQKQELDEVRYQTSRIQEQALSHSADIGPYTPCPGGCGKNGKWCECEKN